jgi:hypothetical protein
MLIASLIALGVVGVIAAGFGWLLAGRALSPKQAWLPSKDGARAFMGGVAQPEIVTAASAQLGEHKIRGS